MILSDQIAEINKHTRKIAHDHPEDYDHRDDFQGYVNLRARLIAEAEKEQNVEQKS